MNMFSNKKWFDYAKNIGVLVLYFLLVMLFLFLLLR